MVGNIVYIDTKNRALLEGKRNQKAQQGRHFFVFLQFTMCSEIMLKYSNGEQVFTFKSKCHILH